MRDLPGKRRLWPAIVALCVGAGVQPARAAGPLDELRRRARSLDIPPCVTFEVALVDGLVVSWTIGFRAESMVSRSDLDWPEECEQPRGLRGIVVDRDEHGALVGSAGRVGR